MYLFFAITDLTSNCWQLFDAQPGDRFIQVDHTDSILLAISRLSAFRRSLLVLSNLL